MSNFKKLILIIFGFWLCIHGMTREQLPNPELSSVKIEWWYPPYINPPTLHTTLTFFETGNIWNGVTPATKLVIKQKFDRIIEDLINAKDLALNANNFSALFPFDETFSVIGIDIISTHPDFANSYVFDISSKNSSINQNKLTKFKNTIETDAFQTHVISTRGGEKVVPKYHWYLVARLDSNFADFRNKLCSSKYFAPFQQSTKYAYLPHITLGRIEKIENLYIFLTLLKALNDQLTIEPKTHIEFKLSEVKQEASDSTIYFDLDKTGNNRIFMIKFGWETLIGKFVRNFVNALPEKEKAASEEALKNSIYTLQQLSSTLLALSSRL